MENLGNRFDNKLAEKVFQYITGVYFNDTQTGLRGIPRRFIQQLIDVKGERFEFENVVVSC